MTEHLRALAVTGVLSAAVWLAACSSDDLGPSPPPTGAPTANADGGEPPAYSEPVPLTTGEYVSPAGLPAAREKGIAAAAEDRAKGVFEGTIANIALFSDWTPFYRYWYPCEGADFKGFEPADMLLLEYLPPGTSALSPQTASVCPDGSVAVVGQQFSTYNSGFVVSYYAGKRALMHDASAERTEETTIGGRPAVVVRPVTEEGFGASWIGIATTKGVIVVDATDLPLSETRRIAEGIRCAEC